MKTGTDPRLAEHIDSVRGALMARGRATRAELSADTGLSTMTIGKLLAVMEQRGEVSQDGTLRGGNGRPSTVARYSGDYAHVATRPAEQKGGHSVFRFCVYDALGRPVHSGKRTIDDVRPRSFDVFFEEAAARGERVRLAVFALPGEARGDCLFISDFERLSGDGFLPGIRRRWQVETLFENDVNAAVYGHSFAETADGCAGIYFPRRFCPGAGLVLDGRIVHGHGNFAGEMTFLHGPQAWAELDYADTPRVAGMIVDLLTALACTVAPQSTVLYGDFLTDALMRMLEEGLRTRLHGQFDMRLSAQTEIGPDMERGARRLGLQGLRALLAGQDVR